MTGSCQCPPLRWDKLVQFGASTSDLESSSRVVAGAPRPVRARREIARSKVTLWLNLLLTDLKMGTDMIMMTEFILEYGNGTSTSTNFSLILTIHGTEYIVV